MRTAIFLITFIFPFLLGSARASSEKSCNDLLLNQIETTVRDLAQLRFDLDLQLGHGKETWVTRALMNGFERKQSEALVTFSANGLTAETLKSKIQIEIKKLQGINEEVVIASDVFKQAQNARIEEARSDFSQMGTLPTPVGKTAQAMLPNRKLIVVGGKQKGNFNYSVQLVDPSNGHSESILPLNHPRIGASIWVLPDGSVLVAGGRSPEVELISADLKTSTDIGRGSAKVLTASQAGLLDDGSIMIVGEEIYQTLLRTYVFYQFNPTTKELVELKRIDGMEAEKAVSVLSDGTVIMSGGVARSKKRKTKAQKVLISTIEKVDPFAAPPPATQWYEKFLSEKLKVGAEVIGDLDEVRHHHQQIVLKDGRILTVGGQNYSESKIQFDVAIFDPVLNSYHPFGTLYEPRTTGCVLTLLSDGRVLVTGGFVSVDSIPRIEIIDPELETIEEVIELAQTHQDPAVTVVSENEVILTDGSNGEIIKIKIGHR